MSHLLNMYFLRRELGTIRTCSYLVRNDKTSDKTVVLFQLLDSVCMCWEYLPVRSLYPCSVEERATASRLQCPCRKQPWLLLMRANGQCRMDRGWHDAYFPIFASRSWQSFRKTLNCLTVPPEWHYGDVEDLRQFFSRKIHQGVEGGSWEPRLERWMESFEQHNDTLHWFLMGWGFWYLVIAVSIGWFNAIPRGFLGGMSPKKLAVWCDSSFVWDSLHFHGYCWENFSL